MARQAALLKAQQEADARQRAQEASLEAKLKAEQEARLKAAQERQRKAAEEAQRKEQMARQAAQLKAQQEAEAKRRAQEAEAQRWIAMAAQHRAAQAQQTADAWTNIEVQRAQASRPPQMSLADWKQQDMQATETYIKQQEAMGLVGNVATNVLDEGAGFALDYATDYQHWTTRFNARPSGNISVSGASDDAARELFGLIGGSARRADTITDAIRPTMLENALPLIDDGADSFLGKFGGPVLTGGLSFLFNLAEYSTDPSLDAGNMWQRIGIGTGVDISLDIGIGIASAWAASAAVPAAIGLAGSLLGIAVTAPAWVPFLATAVIAAGIGIAFDQLGWTDAIKNNINNFVDSIQGE